MTRHIFEALGVTIAFTAGAVFMALVLDIPLVQSYLGLPAHEVADWYRGGATYLGIALFSGLFVDALRFIAAKWSSEPPQARYDIEQIRDS